MNVEVEMFAAKEKSCSVGRRELMRPASIENAGCCWRLLAANTFRAVEVMGFGKFNFFRFSAVSVPLIVALFFSVDAGRGVNICFVGVFLRAIVISFMITLIFGLFFSVPTFSAKRSVDRVSLVSSRDGLTQANKVRKQLRFNDSEIKRCRDSLNDRLLSMYCIQ